MRDLIAQHEKLLAQAADCELIARLAGDPEKREKFRKLAEQLRQMASELAEEIVNRDG